MDAALAGRRIILGVTGSIAAYKAADLASQLGHLGASVHAVLTPHAAEFVGAPTFRALTRNPVLIGVFDEPEDARIAHIQLAQEADLVLVAPATANVLAKMAHGIADDMLTTLLLATTAPVLVAPAMNTIMWEHPATQANIRLLIERGVQLVDPATGILACQVEGKGKLAEVGAIVQAALDRLTIRRDLAGVRVLITAGATREPLDPVRFLSNRSSGKMGFALAEAARERGASVTVVAGHTTAPPPAGAEVVRVGTTRQMLEALEQRFEACDVLIAAAAPADYAPAEVAPSKIKKADHGAALELRLVETPDILRSLAPRKGGRTLVGFAAETDDVVENARGKLARKGLDLIVANDVTAEGAGFEVDTNVVTLIPAHGDAVVLPCLPKRAVAHRILDEVARLRAGQALTPPAL